MTSHKNYVRGTRSINEIRPGGRTSPANVVREDTIRRRIASDYVEYRPPPPPRCYMEWIPLRCYVKECSTETKDCLAMARQKYLAYKHLSSLRIYYEPFRSIISKQDLLLYKILKIKIALIIQRKTIPTYI